MRARTARIFSGLGLAALLLAVPSGMAWAASASETHGSAASSWHESGEATWYGPRHEGKRTTSGERFDGHKLTAAHSSLPMGTWLRVTVEDTGRSIVVRVNDREPPHGVRCIDLSHAAAARLGIVGKGVADVTLAEVAAPAETELAEAPLSHPARHHHHRK